MSTYLIVGGAGFIGSHLVRRLLRDGHEVHVTIRRETDVARLDDVIDQIRVYVVDLDRLDTLHPVFAHVRPDVVFHLAVLARPQDGGVLFGKAHSVLADVSSLLNVLTAAEVSTRPPALLIRTGSLAEYGVGPYPYREEQREQPVSEYAAGMITATHLCEVLRPQLSFPVITARLALVYGPEQSTNFLIPQLVQACTEGGNTHVRYPEERRDLIHVDDVTEALCILSDTPEVNHRTINIATGYAPTMREVAAMVLKETGAPESCITFGAGTGPTGPENLVGSPDLMRELFGWRAKIELEDGLRDLMNYRSPQTFHARLGVAS